MSFLNKLLRFSYGDLRTFISKFKPEASIILLHIRASLIPPTMLKGGGGQRWPLELTQISMGT